MTRLASPVLVAAALSALAAPAFAEWPRVQPAVAAQSVMICPSDASTRRAFQREHGVAPVFVTARETVAARRAGQTWSTPRCMTEREYNRLIATANTRAGL